MNSEHFVRYVKLWELHKKALITHPEIITTRYNVEGKDKLTLDSMFVVEMDGALEKARVFEIEDDTKKLLALTDTPDKNDEIHLPFEVIFLDVSFTKEELEDYGIPSQEAEEIEGIMIRQGEIKTSCKACESDIVGTSIRVSMMSKKDDEVWWDTFSKNINLYNPDEERFIWKENPATDKKIGNFVHKFFLNFLNFLNNPEVIYVEHKRSEGNAKRRAKQGKPPIPYSYTIKVNGKLREYIDEIRSGKSWEYNYRFWVRGHFRDLRSDRYVHKKRIWILPYIKGRGILIEKTYEVRRKENE